MTVHDRNQYLISVTALGMSALAMLFAFLELRSSDRQFEADVWPYVDLGFSLNADQFALSASNKGMGPALIHEFRVYHQDRLIEHPVELLQIAEHEMLGVNIHTESVPDTVLSAGESLEAFTVSGENTGLSVRHIMSDVKIELCYCSLNGACWNNYADTNFHREVTSCQPQGTDINQVLEMFDATNTPEFEPTAADPESP